MACIICLGLQFVAFLNAMNFRFKCVSTRVILWQGYWGLRVPPRAEFGINCASRGAHAVRLAIEKHIT